MLRVLLRVAADTIVVATVLFGTAGTFAWRRAWLLLAVLLVVPRAVPAATGHLVTRAPAGAAAAE